MSRTPVLQFTQVAYGYQPPGEVLHDVTFSLDAGEVIALLGRNGAGKTTLIHLAMGMRIPQRGSIRAFGLDPRRSPIETKRRIGYVAEDQVFPPGMTVRELLDFHRRLFATWDPTLERQLLDRFSLADVRVKIRTLSKGEARQVALICALSHRPELLILDEPAGGLDPASRREMLTASMQLLSDEGTAILHSSHYLSEVERLGGRALILDGGRVVLNQSLDDLREEHCVAAITFRKGLDAEVIAQVPGCVHVRSVAGGWHAVFGGSPARTRQRLEMVLGVSNATCTRVPMEELFIDLLGESRRSVGADEAILPPSGRQAGVR